MSSSNPFRKSTTTNPPDPNFASAFDTSAVPRASQPPPPVSFRASSPSSSPDPDAPAPTSTEPPQGQPKKKKVVKKVRVLSPPPLSPDSPEWPDNKPWSHPQSQPTGVLPGEDADPFTGSDSTPADSGRATPQGNYDVWNDKWEGDTSSAEMMREQMEATEGEALKIGNGNAEGKGMDVGAFQRLLMTGNTAKGSDKSLDQATPSTISGRKLEEEPEGDDAMSDSSMTVQFGQRKKAPPPPPSSRHGKSIPTLDNPEESSQTTKPSEGDASKKPAPAPPPRRGHSRTESKAPTKDAGPPSPPPKAQSNRHSTYVPAPPPPRRPHAAPFPQDTSPTAAASTQEVHSDIDPPVPKISAPPPPPARNTSVRRPPSVHSVEAPSRQVSSDSTASQGGGKKPPPPPARKRGSSKGSMDVPRTMENEGEKGHGQAILSDLEALQREVDALRGVKR